MLLCDYSKGRKNTRKSLIYRENMNMPTYLAKIAIRTIGSGRIDPISLTILAVAGGVALIDYVGKKVK